MRLNTDKWMDSVVFLSVYGLLPVSEFLESQSHSRSDANVKKQGDKSLNLLHSATQQLVAGRFARTSRCGHRQYAGRRTLEIPTDARTLC